MSRKRVFLTAVLILMANLLSGPLAVAAESTSTSTSGSTTSEVEASTSTTESATTDFSTATSTSSTSTSDSTYTSTSTEASTVASSEPAPLQQSPAIKAASAVSVFDSTKLPSYPLGVGTEFTAFAGGTITLGHQDTTGFMGANEIDSMNSWPSLFTPNLPGGLAVSDPQENISLVTNRINANLATVLSNPSMFPNQKIIVNQGNVPAEKKSQHLANDLKSFKDNEIDSSNWQDTTKVNLESIANQYQSLTQGRDVAVSDASIQASQQTINNGTSNKNVHQMTIDLSQYTGKSTPVVVFNLEQLADNDAYEMNYKQASSGILPFIIVNWQNTGAYTWGWNNSFTVSGDASIAALGSHIIDSFPNATKVSIIASKFYGSVLAPMGDIFAGESGLDVMHSSYTAGGDIEMKSQLPLDQATANQFDRKAWPGNQAPVPGKVPSIALTKDDTAVTAPIQVLPGQLVHLGIQTTNYDGAAVEAATDDQPFTSIPIAKGIDLANLAVGKYTITVQIPGYPDIKAQATIIVSGYLTLEEIPNLQFGSKDLSQYVAEPSYKLVNGTTTSDSDSMGDDQLTVKVTDNRYVEQQSPWSLSVQLSPFSDGKTEVNGSISFSSDEAAGLLNGKVTSGQSLAFSKAGSSQFTGSFSDKLSTNTTLNLENTAPEPGTYHGKLSWSLSNAPQ
ncbi:WxL domain-containing protein [Enterococcus sp. 669A]|uniref:WxL domain-containing protein n=1 Tax=Candidatus Enterococcus moelleringii TaxID=2815325 RepID=A0ABS3L5P4_9ENTE|nr:choice-of-anchor A family protein [Enterococcus sp. 669A]MBO1304895.1 WxL domain-containing protein [Enterococcus sp. 669A]